ncbi:MAG: autotransporter-associated beta strand repeat-containing protein, partial [Parvibaculum sp.]|uniref:autotransporter-associated beta strand repeat-containing protein n=1 Tax=Parvibaculum sp. TaxID=2024848 RepID=UPI0032EE6091
MNRFYRHIWSKTLGQAIVVPECAGGGAGRKAGRRRGGSLVALMFMLAALPAGTALADTNWTGAVDGDWFNAANWTNGVPANTGAYSNINGPVTAVVGAPGGTTEDRTSVGSGSGVSGSVTIENGGSLTTGCCFYLGNNGGTGTMTVSGTGTVTTTDIFMIGNYTSTGHLTIENGGTVNSGSSTFVGRWDGSTGFATVTGQDSVWNTSWNLTLAGEVSSSLTAHGELTISDGGLVRVNSGNSALRIGYAADSTGLLNIGAAEGDLAAAAGMLQASSAVFGAGNSSIVFNHTDAGYIFSTPISGNGEVRQLAGTTSLTGSNSWAGSTVVEGGVLRAGGASGLSGNATYEVNGGTLDFNDFSRTIAALSGTGGTVDLGSATLTVDQSVKTVFAGAIGGSGGSLVKTGFGTLTLTGTNTYTGGTTIAGGSLVGNSASLAGDIEMAA